LPSHVVVAPIQPAEDRVERIQPVLTRCRSGSKYSIAIERGIADDSNDAKRTRSLADAGFRERTPRPF
jgi:hypothetical protein